LETSGTLKEVVNAYNNVEKWAKPEKLPFDLMTTPMRPVIRKEAKGVVLIIAPFNYPAFLALGPLVRPTLELRWREL
jgi:aldehyde dehydrogenase (NAD+)